MEHQLLLLLGPPTPSLSPSLLHFGAQQTRHYLLLLFQDDIRFAVLGIPCLWHFSFLLFSSGVREWLFEVVSGEESALWWYGFGSNINAVYADGLFVGDKWVFCVFAMYAHVRLGRWAGRNCYSLTIIIPLFASLQLKPYLLLFQGHPRHIWFLFSQLMALPRPSVYDPPQSLLD